MILCAQIAASNSEVNLRSASSSVRPAELRSRGRVLQHLPSCCDSATKGQRPVFENLVGRCRLRPRNTRHESTTNRKTAEIEASLCQGLCWGALDAPAVVRAYRRVGFGSDFSEVPVSGCEPAALDSESPLIVLPDPAQFSGRGRRARRGRWRHRRAA